jgi:hypothetical protein
MQRRLKFGAIIGYDQKLTHAHIFKLQGNGALSK